MTARPFCGVLFSPRITPDYPCASLADAHGVGFGNPHRVPLGTKGGTKMSIRTIPLFLALLCISVSLRAADDPVIGVWKLNVAKSKYSPGPTPKGATITYETIPGGGQSDSSECGPAREGEYEPSDVHLRRERVPVTGIPNGSYV